jgi:hypothetical protein
MSKSQVGLTERHSTILSADGKPHNLQTVGPGVRSFQIFGLRMTIYRLVGLLMSMLQVPVVGLLKQSFQTDGRRGPSILIDELQVPAGWYSNRRTSVDRFQIL